MDKCWVLFGVHVAISSDNGSAEGISAGWLRAWLLSLNLNGLRLGQTSLQAKSFSSHFLRLGIATLHFKLVGFLEVIVNRCLKLSEVGLTPFPLVAVLSEVLPGDKLRPFSEQARKITCNVRNFADNGLILLELLHDL
jgi:hypothetical protein